MQEWKRVLQYRENVTSSISSQYSDSKSDLVLLSTTHPHRQHSFPGGRGQTIPSHNDVAAGTD